MSDLRQRFYIENCPVRGEVVHLEQTLSTIFAHVIMQWLFVYCWVKCYLQPPYWPVR